jgi:hypothetical protein
MSEFTARLSATQFISVLRKIPPAYWDIIPHAGQMRQRANAAALRLQATTALNPQPIPPQTELLFAAAQVAHDIAHTAQALGQEAIQRITLELDDWCGTRPRGPKIPWPWPRSWALPFELHTIPQGLDPAQAQLVGALTFADVASRMDDGPVRDVLSAGADRLLQASLSAQSALQAQTAK